MARHHQLFLYVGQDRSWKHRTDGAGEPFDGRPQYSVAEWKFQVYLILCHRDRASAKVLNSGFHAGAALSAAEHGVDDGHYRPKDRYSCECDDHLWLLNLNRHDSLHGEVAHELEADCRDQHALADRLGDEEAHVTRVHNHEDREHEHREAADNDTRHLLLGHQRIDLAPDALPLAHGTRNLVQNLGQVAADRALYIDRGEDHIEVAAVDALADGVQSILSAHAQVGVAKHPADLQGDWGLHLPRGELETLHKAVTGLKRVRD